MKIGVIGMGPVGSTMAAHLHNFGAQVIACDVNPHITDAITSSGITLTHAIEMKAEQVSVCRTITGLKMYDPDLVIVAVKAPVMDIVFKELKQIDNERMMVLCAQNGIDNEKQAAEYFSEDRVMRMVINYAGNMSNGSTVFVSFFNPPNYLAPMTEKGKSVAEKFVSILNKSGLKTELTDHIQDHVWEKAILNSALNAVCAITRRTMKDVMDFPNTLTLVEALLDESIQTARASGIKLPDNFKDFSMTYLKKAGHHKPSMLADMEAGRKTEVDWLNGKVAVYGKISGSDTPINEALTSMVHLMEFPSQAHT